MEDETEQLRRIVAETDIQHERYADDLPAGWEIAKRLGFAMTRLNKTTLPGLSAIDVHVVWNPATVKNRAEELLLKEIQKTINVAPMEMRTYR